MLDELNTYTLQELYKQPIEPIPWVVEDLLAPGLYFLGGSPKVGKSWLALQLCLVVCQGEPFLGFKTRRTEVLYISLEDGPRRLHIRALRLTEEAPAGLHLCSLAHLIGHGLEQQLDQMLAEHPAIKLVIIDTLQKIRVEKVQQRIPQQWEMQKLLQCILQEPLLYRVYYLMALSTGLRRGELCALRWSDLHGGNQVKIQHSRSTVVGQGVLESDTKNHRTRIVVMPQIVFDDLGELFTEQALENNGADWNGLIFQRKGKPIHPDSFSRHLRQLYDRNGFPEEYHLHTMRHFFATYLLEHGTSKQVAADLLGHADTAFLERTYCHPQDIYKEEAAGLFDSLLAPAEEEYCDTLQN